MCVIRKSVREINDSIESRETKWESHIFSGKCDRFVGGLKIEFLPNAILDGISFRTLILSPVDISPLFIHVPVGRSQRWLKRSLGSVAIFPEKKINCIALEIWIKYQTLLLRCVESGWGVWKKVNQQSRVNGTVRKCTDSSQETFQR